MEVKLSRRALQYTECRRWCSILNRQLQHKQLQIDLKIRGDSFYCRRLFCSKWRFERYAHVMTDGVVHTRDAWY